MSPNPAEKGVYVFFNGKGNDPDGGKVSYKWSSDISGELSKESSFLNYSLTVGEHIITLQVTDDEGSTATAQKTLTITKPKNGSDATELKDEESVSACIAKGEEHLYFIDVPNTATAVIIKTEGDCGKAVNLYLHRNVIPTVDNCSLKSVRIDGDEWFRIDASGSDTASDDKNTDIKVCKAKYYILVKPEGDGGSYNLKVRYLELRFPFVGDCTITLGYNSAPTHQSIYDLYALDFALNCYDYGRVAVAPEDATVIGVGTTDTGYGRYVTLSYGDDYTSIQGHFATASVRAGITVQKGQEVGIFGNTGVHIGKDCDNLGTHQHFVLRKDNKSIKPEPMSGKIDFEQWDDFSGDGVSNPDMFIVVDDTEATTQGTAAFTTYDQMGYNDTMQTVAGAGKEKPATATMMWIPNIVKDGNYRVFAYIPRENNTAKIAYSIAHNGKVEIRGLDQAPVDNKWILLSPAEGWYFSASDESYVRLNNSDIPENEKVGFDAIMFTATEYGPSGGGEAPKSILRNWNFENSNTPVEWILEDHHNSATMHIDPTGGYDGGKCLLVEVKSKQEEYYYVQAKQRNIALINGDNMTLSFQFKAEQPGNYYVSIEKDADPWNTFGIFQWIKVTDTAWHKYSFQFTAKNNPEECPELIKLTFDIGETEGSARLDDVILQKTELIVVEPEPIVVAPDPVVIDPEPEIDPIVEDQSSPPSYTYIWMTSAWSSCSSKCGTGEKTRYVWCERNDGTRVNDSYCSNSGANPASKMACSDTSECQNPTNDSNGNSSSNSDSGSDSGSDTNSGSNSGSDSNSGSNSGSDSDSGSDSGSNSGSGSSSGSRPKSSSDSKFNCFIQSL